MKINIDLKNLDKVKGNFQERNKRIKKAINVIISKSLLVIERETKIEAPVKTGRLRASITEGKELFENFARIGPTVFYAKYVHLRNPFMERGVKQALPEIKRIAKEEIKNAVNL